MDTPHKVRITTVLQRKDPRLPVYVALPDHVVGPWQLTGTTIVEGTANGVAIGRRTIKAWGKGTRDWFVEFTSPFCAKASIRVGDRVALDLNIADTSDPKELVETLVANKKLTASWNALSNAAKRDAAEHIRSGKTKQTRSRRAAILAKRLLDK
jgi:hypothetical protein